MWDFIDVMIKIIPLIAAVLAIVRFIISTMNKSIIEIILTPNSKKHWEDFYELVVISLIVTAGVSVPGFIESPFSNQVANIIFLVDLSLMIVTGITVIILWIVSWFKDISSKRVIEFSVLGNFLSVLLLMVLIFSALDKEINKLIIEHDISELMIIYIICAFFVFSLFQLYRLVYKTLNKSKKIIYQIESIDPSLINEEIKNLKFEFMLDDERHVLSKSSNRSYLDLPIFIYYPKEDKLIKYFRIL